MDPEKPGGFPHRTCTRFRQHNGPRGDVNRNGDLNTPCPRPLLVSHPRLSERLSVSQVDDLVRSHPLIDQRACRVLERDRRAGVRRIAVRAREQMRRRESECARVRRMREFETRLWRSGVQVVAGVDEVGRGCLAGPVVAAAVAFPPGVELWEIDDSKKLPPEVRETLCRQILEQAECAAVVSVGVPEIDELNILQASLKAMRKALQGTCSTTRAGTRRRRPQAGEPVPRDRHRRRRPTLGIHRRRGDSRQGAPRPDDGRPGFKVSPVRIRQ